MNHYCILASIIVIIGGTAGYTNFLTYYYKGIIEKKNGALKCVLSGIGAAILVPLFLNMLSSSLIENDNDFNPINYFVFAGFCFIAGYFSDRFISTIGEKVLKEVEQAKKKAEEVASSIQETKDKIDFIVDTESETDLINPDEAVNDDLNLHLDTDVVDKVVSAFDNKNYKFRTTKGLAKQIELPVVDVEEILNYMKQKGSAKNIRNRQGMEHWALTSLGKETLRRKAL